MAAVFHDFKTRTNKKYNIPKFHPYPVPNLNLGMS